MKNSYDEVTPKIIAFLKQTAKPISKTKLAEQLNYNPSTISKYVDILELKGIVKVEKYGNIHLVTIREGENGE